MELGLHSRAVRTMVSSATMGPCTIRWKFRPMLPSNMSRCHDGCVCVLVVPVIGTYYKKLELGTNIGCAWHVQC